MPGVTGYSDSQTGKNSLLFPFISIDDLTQGTVNHSGLIEIHLFCLHHC